MSAYFYWAERGKSHCQRWIKIWSLQNIIYIIYACAIFNISRFMNKKIWALAWSEKLELLFVEKCENSCEMWSKNNTRDAISQFQIYSVIQIDYSDRFTVWSLYHANYITSIVIKIAIKMQLSEWIRDEFFFGESDFTKIVNVSSGFHSYRNNSIKNSHDLHFCGFEAYMYNHTYRKLLYVRWLQIRNIIKITNPLRKNNTKKSPRKPLPLAR